MQPVRHSDALRSGEMSEFCILRDGLGFPGGCVLSVTTYVCARVGGKEAHVFGTSQGWHEPWG